MARQLVVIGGVAAGLSAAGRAKRLTPDCRVTVFERTGYCSYTACGLPYFISGVIGNHGDLLMRSPEELAREGIDVRVRHEVTGIDRNARTVSVVGLDSGASSTVAYDDLLIAAGAAPIAPIPGVDLNGCFVVRLSGKGLAGACSARAASGWRGPEPGLIRRRA